MNLNTEDKSITYGEDIIIAFSLVTQDIFIKNKYMILKYLEFYRNLYYTNLENMTDSEIWLASLTAKNFTELEKMLSHVLSDQDKFKIIKEAIRMSNWNFSLHEWEKEKMDELVRQESERVDREEREAAIKKGIEQGIEQGIEKGIEQGIENNIKKMLEKNLDKQLISEITGKTIPEIDQIEQKLKNN